ncbi:hypothetical protein D9611_013239 [Ephemerocybe angulata]|uniref:Transcriptional adapter 2 n=1 Tax=Ephemerocybe angulata TaxID=980116 RepID=A0A8H5CB15_9AGAR|nr:hypothetical protein D9611_013239 [Tulosesus angulatus]
MTVTQRKPQQLPEEVQILNEPEINITCDSCKRDLTHTVRIKCADPVCCKTDEPVDICPGCFCAGKEFGNHKRWHSYRVIEMNSYPIFTEDWGADEELLLITGIQTYGIGNWKKIAEHIGTRTKEEVAEHYDTVYVKSPDWPLPRMDLRFDVDPEEFQERKRRRITAMNEVSRPLPGPAPTSAPAVHEISTFLPGRLEFEQEIDNEAENLVKDLEFGVVLQYGGDQIPEDENDPDVRARQKWEEDKLLGLHHTDESVPPSSNGGINGHHMNGIVKKETPKTEDVVMANGDEESDEPTQPIPFETQESLNFKLTLLEMYFQRLEKRLESKALMFDRGLLEYKKIQANEKKRPKEEREFLHRLRPFSRLQTAADYEAFSTDMLYEAILRKRIQELQQYRRLGLCNSSDIDKYEIDLAKRTQMKASVGFDRRHLDDKKSREPTPRLPASGSGPPARKAPAPLNLANSPCLHLLSGPEIDLCSMNRIQPKAYLVVKEILVREYARRGGKLRRREARDLVKLDVNKTAKVWDLLVGEGYLKIPSEVQNQPGGVGRKPTGSGSPQKEAAQTVQNGVKSPVIAAASKPAPPTPSSAQFTFAVPFPGTTPAQPAPFWSPSHS